MRSVYTIRVLLTRLEAHFAIQAETSNLSGTSRTIATGIDTAMNAAQGATKDDFVLINGITIRTTHFIRIWLQPTTWRSGPRSSVSVITVQMTTCY